jgi:hypothetical protein
VSMLRALHQFLQCQARLPRNTEELEKLPLGRGAPEQETSNAVRRKSDSASHVNAFDSFMDSFMNALICSRY